MVEIFGPCIPPEIQVIKCRFGKNDHFVTYGFKVDAERVRCSVPFLTFKGWTTIELALGFNQYMYSTKILVGKINHNFFQLLILFLFHKHQCFIL